VGRPLSADERRVILKILEPDFGGVEILREQVSEAFATRNWIEGLPSIDIMVGETVPAAPGNVASPIDRTLVINESGTTIGFLLLWIEAGRLSGLEYAWVTDEPPTDLPPDEWIINQE
jgi:hypothetical protein